MTTLLNLVDLPHKILNRICCYLEEKDISDLMDTCGSLRKYKNDVDIWSRFYEEGITHAIHNDRWIFNPSRYIRVEEYDLVYYRSRNKTHCSPTIVKTKIYGSPNVYPDMILVKGGGELYSIYKGIDIAIDYESDSNTFTFKTDIYEAKIYHRYDDEYYYVVSIKSKIKHEFRVNEEGFIIYNLDDIMDSLEPNWRDYIDSIIPVIYRLYV
jgi:hypothetical protein